MYYALGMGGMLVRSMIRYARLHSDLERCDREIAEASAHMNAPAYLVTLGVEDWRVERRMIEQELAQPSLEQSSTTPSEDR